MLEEGLYSRECCFGIQKMWASAIWSRTAKYHLAGPAPGANIVKKSSPWEPQYYAPDFNIAPLVA